MLATLPQKARAITCFKYQLIRGLLHRPATGPPPSALLHFAFFCLESMHGISPFPHSLPHLMHPLIPSPRHLSLGLWLPHPPTTDDVMPPTHDDAWRPMSGLYLLHRDRVRPRSAAPSPAPCPDRDSLGPSESCCSRFDPKNVLATALHTISVGSQLSSRSFHRSCR